LPIRKEKPLASCAISNMGVCSTAQSIFAKLNEFIEKHGFDWMKYEAVATNGTAVMKLTTNGVVRKSKTFPLTMFQPVLWAFFSHRLKLVFFK